MYVYGIDKEKNQVILTDEADLFSSELIADDLNLISVPKIEGKMRVKSEKMRYRHTEQPATVEQLDENVFTLYSMSAACHYKRTGCCAL